MADAPPETIDQPAQIPILAPGGDASPIILTRLAWPFTELQAQQVPAALPLARPDVQLTLSQLAGMAQGVPKMVQVDAQGNLGASSPPLTLKAMPVQPNTEVQQSYQRVAGQHGLAVLLPGGPGNYSRLQLSGDTTGTLYYTQLPNQENLGFYVFPLPFPWEASFTLDVVAGAGVVGDGLVRVAAILDTVAQIVTVAGAPPLKISWGDLSAPPPRPLDGTILAKPASGVRASATLAAVGNARWVAHALMASLVQTAAAAGNLGLRLRDGASGAGTELWSTVMAVDATAGDRDRLVVTGLNVVGSLNTAMTLEFDAGLAGVSSWCSLGAYFHA